MKNIRIYLLLTCLATCTYTLFGANLGGGARTPPNTCPDGCTSPFSAHDPAWPLGSATDASHYFVHNRGHFAFWFTAEYENSTDGTQECHPE